MSTQSSNSGGTIQELMEAYFKFINSSNSDEFESERGEDAYSEGDEI